MTAGRALFRAWTVFIVRGLRFAEKRLLSGVWWIRARRRGGRVVVRAVGFGIGGGRGLLSGQCFRTAIGSISIRSMGLSPQIERSIQPGTRSVIASG